MYQPAGYSEVFLDDFSGSAVDSTVWTVSNGTSSDGLGTFQSSVGVVSNSILTLSVTGSPNYYSWHMKSVLRYLYGYFEAKIQLPVVTVSGAWGAGFWLWNSDDGGSPNTNYQEMDIDEPHSQLQQHSFNTIWQTNPSKLQNQQFYGTNPYDGLWHVTACLWTPSTITMYLDGVNVYQIANPFPAGQDRPMYLVLDAKTGGYGGTPDPSLAYPLVSNCDYIGVWQPAGVPVSYWS
jgi:beta-glucanase (GH16 family)